MLLIRLLYRFIALFETHATPQGLAFGVCLGMLMGLSPSYTLQFWIALSLVFLIQLNLASLCSSCAVFSLINYLGGSLFKKMGISLLTPPVALKFWSAYFEAPILPFTDFNNPQILGSFLFGLLALVPIFMASVKITQRLEPTIYHWWRTTKAYNLYRGYKPYAR
ncbi:MAG: TIGR03546 family protein [Deltaproteobacteria bacterium]